MKIWKMIEAFTPSVLVRFDTTNGLMVQCMDQCHASLLEWCLRPEHFKAYDVYTPSNLCVSVPHMIKVLANAGMGSTLTWEFETDATVLKVTVTPKTGSMFSEATYTIRLLDSDEELLVIPDNEYTSACFSTKALNKTVSHLRALSSEVSHVYLYQEKMIADESVGDKQKSSTCLVCSVETSNVPRATMRLPDVNVDDGATKEDEECYAHSINTSLAYQATLLHRLLDAGNSLGDIVRVHWNPMSPLILTVVDSTASHASEISTYGVVRVYLAPRDDDAE